MSRKCIILGLLGIACIGVLAGCQKAVPEENESEMEVVETETEVTDVLQVAEPVQIGTFTLSEEGLNGGIIRPGNTARLKAVMKKAAAGEKITVTFLGGSITAGSNATPIETESYAYLTYDWFARSFPDAEIEYINAGIGGTDSYLGVHRLNEEVLVNQPDLVITEFSVNDNESYNKESYECVIRRILQQENAPAVVPLILTKEDGWDYSENHQLVAFYYDLPIVSYKEAMNKGNIAWAQVGDTDGVHPKNDGHRMIAHLLTSYFYNVAGDVYGAPAAEYHMPDDAQSKGTYMQANLVYAKDIEALDFVQIDEMEGFVEESYPYSLKEASGFGCEEGGKISFTVRGKALGLCFAQTRNHPGGSFVVMVDGVEVSTINTQWDRAWNKTATMELFKEKEVMEHTITISSVPGEEGSLHIFALMITAE